ncbi:MAG: hypothetical protein LBN11_08335 [Tannerella sp.]|jgi:hypothetical protein|nr:hypothetical protein [Tannerella sp.]
MKRHSFFSILWHSILGVALIAGFGAVVMLLWNWLIPDIFGLAVINFWQSLGLLVLARLFFGFGGWFAGHDKHHGGFGKNPIRERWEKMTLEERKEFVKNRRNKHCFGHGFGHAFGDEFLNGESEKED